MLYDSKWEKEAYILSLDGFISWLRLQPRGTKFIYQGSDCAVHRYLVANGYDRRKYSNVGIWSDRKDLLCPEEGLKVQTYGEVLDRADAFGY